MDKKISEQRKALYRKDILAGEKKDVGDEIKGWVKSKVTSAVLWLGHKVSILFPDKDKAEVLTAFKDAVSDNIKDYEKGVKNYIKENFSYVPLENTVYKKVIAKAGRFEQISKEDLENLKKANTAHHLLAKEDTIKFINEEKSIYNEKLDEMINLISESERESLSFEAILKNKINKSINEDVVLSPEERKIIKDELSKNKTIFDQHLLAKKETNKFIKEEKSEYDKRLDDIIGLNLINELDVNKLSFEAIVRDKTGKNMEAGFVLSEEEKKTISDELSKNKKIFDQEIKNNKIKFLEKAIQGYKNRYNSKLENLKKLELISADDEMNLNFDKVFKNKDAYSNLISEGKSFKNIKDILDKDVELINNNLNEVILKNQEDTSEFLNLQRQKYEPFLNDAKAKGINLGSEVEFDNIVNIFIPKGQTIEKLVILKEKQAEFKKFVDNQINIFEIELRNIEEAKQVKVDLQNDFIQSQFKRLLTATRGALGEKATNEADARRFLDNLREQGQATIQSEVAKKVEELNKQEIERRKQQYNRAYAKAPEKVKQGFRPYNELMGEIFSGMVSDNYPDNIQNRLQFLKDNLRGLTQAAKDFKK